MSQPHILITGGHSGIGLELTRRLMKETGHKLGLVLRSEKRKASLPEDLRNSAQLEFFYADLSDQGSVTQLTQAVASKWEQLDVLFSNAGVLLDKFYLSNQGNEMHLEVNTLAPYLLVKGLAPLFEPADRPTVVHTVTGNMHRQKSLNLEVFQSDASFKKLFGPYLQSKLALTLLSKEMQALSPKLRVVNVDPGPNKTTMTQGAGMPAWLMPIRNLFFPKPTKGASLLYNGAFDAKFQQEKFAYLTSNKLTPIEQSLTASEKEFLMGAIKE
ncbi:MAG: SDR family NAD(P)-dependent oxidoreductase [Bacteroidota bacterium]